MQKLLNLILVAFLVTAAAPAARAADPSTPLDKQVADLRNEWARIKFTVTDADVQQKDIIALEAVADEALKTFPDRPEPKIWTAIILATDAGITKSISGLPKLKRAKALLEAALKEDDKALGGSAYTTLGSLYYQVPGWPLSFGDKDKAAKNLKAALAINPDGAEPNYFYGDYLLKTGDYAGSLVSLQHALEAKPREGFETIDAGRKKEINQAIAEADKKANKQAASHLN